ncbi:MAG: glycosyltransferase family 39 protein [Candidatus Shapirobacteria bacterium]
MLKKFLKNNWLLILILLLASFLRLYKIGDYMEFLGDQGRDVLIIRDFLKHGNLFFIGPQTSIGNMYLGPFFYYLIAPALLLTNFNPIGPAIFIALINIFTVYLVYFIGKKWFNQSTGLISAFIFAISPVAIRYSNFIWNPNIMPLFSLLFIYFFFESFRTKKYKYLIFASLSFVMVMNSHYLGLALLPFVGLYWLFNLYKFIKQKSPQLKPLLINTFFAVFVFILSLTPQVLFDIKHNGQNSKALLTFFTQRETTVNIKLYKAIPKFPALFNQVNTSLLAGRNETFGLVVSIVFALFLFLTLVKFKTQKPTFWYVFFWFLSGIVALALYKQHIYNHYFGFLFPVAFLLVGFLISKYKFFGILLLISITIFSFLENPFRWQPNYQLRTTQQVANLIVSNSNNQDFNFALLSKMGWGFSYYLIENKNYFEIKDKLTDQLFVVCVPFQIDCNPINNPEYNVAAFGWAKIDSQWEINDIKIFKLVHTQTSQNSLK